MQRKRYSPSKRCAISDDIIERLSNREISPIERVQLAEKCRQKYNWSQEDMLVLTGISSTQYYRYQLVHHSGDERLFDLVKRRVCSVDMAIKEIKEPGYLEKREQYCLRDRLEQKLRNIEMIYEQYKYALFRVVPSGECYLSVAYTTQDKGEMMWGREHTMCLVDDNKAILDTIVELLQQGCTVSKTFRVTKPNKSSAMLYYYIVSAFSGVAFDEVVKSATRMKRKPRWSIDNRMYDMRICNLLIPDELSIKYAEVTGGNVIVRRKNDIVIINEKNGSVNYTDYSPWFYSFLRKNSDNIRVKSKDRRLCIPVGNRVEYLHHIVLAIKLYGEPTEGEPLSKKLQKLRTTYFDLDFEVDHLDGDSRNNRLSNLMLMSESDHTKKHHLFKRLDDFNAKLRMPYKWSVVKTPYKKTTPCVCKLERYDNKSVRLQMGMMGSVSQDPEYMVQGVYTVPEMLYQLATFLHNVEQNENVFAEFSRVEAECGGD